MKKLFLLSSFFFIISSFGYTSDDLANANSLADQQIIMKQTIASNYRLDDKVLRQEVVAMALKIKGIPIPENTLCKKYFADAIKNDWVCRAVELAADNGIITRNKYTNPGKYVTRAEALAMLMNAGGLNPEDLPAGGGVHSDATVGWQGIIIDAASKFGILDKDNYYMKRTDFSGDVMDDGMQMIFSPNRLALRSEVFRFAKNVLSSQNSIAVQLTYIGENAKGGDSAYGICKNSMILITENTKIIKTPAILKSTLETLLDEKNNPESNEFGPWNLSSMYDLELQSVGIVNNVASIYLKHSEQTLTHATQDDLLAHVNSQSGGMQFSKENLLCGIGAQITTLAKQFSTVQNVRVYINNVLISEM